MDGETVIPIPLSSGSELLYSQGCCMAGLLGISLMDCSLPFTTTLCYPCETNYFSKAGLEVAHSDSTCGAIVVGSRVSTFMG